MNWMTGIEKNVWKIWLIVVLAMVLPMGRAAAQTHWSNPTRLPSGGNYILDTDVTTDHWAVNTNTTLALNGHTVTYTGSSNIGVQLGATLVIDDDYKNSGSFKLTGGGKIDVTSGKLFFSGGTIRGDIGLENVFGSSGAAVYMEGGILEGRIIFEESEGALSYAPSDVYMYNGTIRCSIGACVEMNYEKGTFNLIGGTITSVAVPTAIWINAGEFNQYDGTISMQTKHENGSNGIMFGTANKASTGSYVMSGGSISGFEATPGISEGGFGVYLYNGGRFTMTGGKISDNNGGGILLGSNGSFTMIGGEITGNGLGVYYTNAGDMYIAGSPKITGNDIKNVNLFNKKINVTGELNSDARIGITLQDGASSDLVSGTFTAGLNGMGSPDNFTADNSNYMIGTDPEGEAVFGGKRTVHFRDKSGSTLAPSQTVPYGGTVSDPGITPPEGQMVIGWYQETRFTNKWDFARYTYNNTSSTMTLYARIEDAVASIGETKYATLQEALEAAGTNKTVKLLRDVTLDAPLEIQYPINSFTLDLNGHTLSRGLTAPTADGYVIRIGIARTLTIKDSSAAQTGLITGGNNTDNGGGILIDERGSLVLEGGKISGNSAANGGGVYFGTDASTLVIHGGEISGNTGGNLYLGSGKLIAINRRPAAGTNISLTLAAGSGEFAESTGGYNGGILSTDDVMGFTSDNSAYAAGVKPDGRGFFGTRVNISFVTPAGTPAPAPVSAAAGGLVPRPAVTVPEGQALAGWYKESSFENKWNFNSNTADSSVTALYAKFVNAEPVAAIGEVKYLTVQDALDDAVSGDTVSLLKKKVEIDEPLNVASGKTITLDLAGFTIDRGMSGAARQNYGNVITVDGGGLTLTGNGTLTGGSGTQGGGVNVRNSGTFTLESGTISGNNGGGVYVNSGDFIMAGGTISGNTADYGGGVYLFGAGSKSSSFTMKGGTISSNTAGHDGGAVFIWTNSMFILENGTISGNSAGRDGGAVYASGAAETTLTAFTMKGGQISANNAGRNGGALYLHHDGDGLIEGGTITNNSANGDGGGIYDGGLQNNITGSVTITGGSITGNKKGTDDNNIYLPNGKYLTVPGTPAAGTSIGISMETPGVFWKGLPERVAPAVYFSSDDTNYGVGKKDSDAALGYIVSFDANEGTGTMTDRFFSIGDASFYKFPGEFTREGFQFSGWNTAADGSGTSIEETDFIRITQNMTLYAQWLTVWQWVQSQLDAGVSSITLPGNATAGPDDQALITKAGTAVTINLNDFTLDRGNPDYYTDHGGGIFSINDGSVIVAKSDLTITGLGTITGGNNNGNGGGIRVEAGNLTIGKDVTISGNKASGNGGGISIDHPDSVLQIIGGTISGNTAGTNGGGISADRAKYLRIYNTKLSGNSAGTDGGGLYLGTEVQRTYIYFGTEISGNTAGVNGGGIRHRGGTVDIGIDPKDIIILPDSSLDRNAENTVSGNTADDKGGGISSDSGTLSLKGYTSIQNNSAGIPYSGGIIISSGASLSLSGNPQINGNKDAFAANNGSNLFLENNSSINIAGTLETGASVGVSRGMFVGNPFMNVFTSGLNGKGSVGNFFSDNPLYAVGLYNNGEAYLDTAYTVSFDTGSSGIPAPDAQKVAFGSKVTEPTLSSEDWFFIEGWYTEADFQNKWDFAGSTVSGNMTLYAKFLTVWQWVQHELDAGVTSITLPGDAAAGASDGPLTTGAAVTIDLNGHNIDRGLTGPSAVANGNVITANGDLILNDSVGGGRITGGNNTGNGGGIVMKAGDLYLWDVTISGNESERHGGGIYFAVSGRYLYIEANPVIEENSAHGAGGGIYAENVSIQKTDIRQAVIRKNSAAMAGGGIYFTGTEGFYIRNITITENSAGNGGGIFIETGGPITLGLAEITKNKAEDSGGGIYMKQAKEFTIHTVTIDENTAKNDGGGVYLSTDINSKSVFTGETSIQSNTTENGNGGGIYFDNGRNAGISGKVLVSGNRSNSKENNIYLTGNSFINIYGTLDPDTRAGITMAAPGVFTSGLSQKGDNTHFFSDDPAYAVGLNNRFEAYLGAARTVTFVLDKGGTSVTDPDPAEVKVPDGSRITPPTVGNIPEGYGLDSWYMDNTYTTKWNFGDTVSGDMTLYARIREAVASLTYRGNTSLYNSVQEAIDPIELMYEGYVTLLKDVTPEDSIKIEGKNVYFDLAGHKINGSSGNLTYAVIEVSQNSKLVLRDSSSGQTGAIIGGSNSTGGIYVIGSSGDSSYFTMEGGTITSSDYPAVFVRGEVAVTMSGGKIINNHVASGYDRSGGIFFEPIDSESPSFTLAGGNGTVSGNTDGDGKTSNIWLPGGMIIEVTAALTGEEGSIGITMESGTGVFARATSDYNGGKLTEADAAVFFSDNPNYIVRLNGNGEAELVRAYTVDFEVSGHGTAPDSQKVVSGEKVTEPVYTAPKEYVLTGWYTDAAYTTPWDFDNDTVTGNITLYANLDEAVAAIGETGYLTVQDAVNAAQTGETVMMLKDVVLSVPVEIPDGKILTLDLNGCTVERGNPDTRDGNVITVYGNLTLEDGRGGGAVTGGKMNIGSSPDSAEDGGGIIVESGGTFILESGIIGGNNAHAYGSGVNLHSGGSFIMNGGLIAGNGTFPMDSSRCAGSGVYVNENASFTMNGGEISENSAAGGGGVYVEGTFTMNGGSIRENTVKSAGGGVLSVGTFIMNGGTISQNGDARFEGEGAGVAILNGSFEVSGGNISGNINVNNNSNVYLANGQTITLKQQPAEGTNIGITLQSGSGVFAEGSGHTISADDKAYFFSDNAQYVVGLNADKRLFLGKSYTVSFDANAAEGVTGTMDDQTFIEGEEQELTAHAFKRTGYGFTGWNTEPTPTTENPGTAYDDGEEITVTGNLTLYAQWALNKHTVTFIPNDSEGSVKAEGTMHAEQFDYGTKQALTENAFTRTGYEFTGWNTEADGSGTAYADKAEVTIEDDLTLYAQWELIEYTITYDLKGGSLPEGQTNPASYTVETDDFTLVNPIRIGYSFDGWWDGGSFTQTVNIPKGSTGDRHYEADLWGPNTYEVRYEPNGAGGSVRSQSFIYEFEQNLMDWNLTGTDGNPFPYTGYRFTEWNTAADGTGTGYEMHQTVKNLTAEPNGTVTLYAQWAPITYTVHFESNEGSGTMEDQTFTYDAAQALTANGFERPGWTFVGWNTKADGTGTNYSDGETLTNLSSTAGDVITLYAHWTQKPIHTVTFEPNGGAGSAYHQNAEEGTPTSLTPNTFTRSGWTFSGWNTAADGSGDSYADKEAITLYADQTLYAQWAAVTYSITYHLNGGMVSGTNPAEYSPADAAITLINPTRTGYTFTGWEGTGISGTVLNVTIPTGSTGSREYTAVWNANRYSVAFDGNEGTGTMGVQSFIYDASQNLWPNAFTRKGFNFLGWNTAADGSGHSYSDGESVRNLTDVDGETVTLFAQWTQNSIRTITFDANDGSGRMNTQNVIEDVVSRLSPNQFDREHYSFKGWNTAEDGTGTSYGDEASVTLNADLTLYAQWEPVTYTIRFHANGGEGTMAEQLVRYTPGYTQLNAHTFTREGYGFDRWNTASDGSGTFYNDGIQTIITEDLDLYAQWAANVHTVTFLPNGGTGTMYAERFPYGSEQALSMNAFTREGYEFTGWKDAAGKDYSNGQSVTIDADLVLTAQWAVLTYSLAYDLGGGTLSGSNPASYTVEGGDITLINPTRTGYTFAGWQGTGISGTELTVTIPSGSTGNRAYTAVWTANRYHVSYISNGGTGTMADQDFIYDVPQALTALGFTREGFTFVGWNTSPDGTGHNYSDGVTVHNLTDVNGRTVLLYAIWTQKPVHIVTFEPNGGAESAYQQNMTEGIAASLSPNQFTREHYTFDSWNTRADGTGTAYADEASLALTADLTLYAQWKPQTYSVSFDSNGGEGTMADQDFVYAVPQALAAHSFTRDGHGFIGWNTAADGSGTAYHDGESITVFGNITLYAQWGANVHTVTFLANGGEGIMDAEIFEFGQTLNLTRNSFERSGYEFSGWNTAADGSETAYTDGQEITIDFDLTLYAQWTANAYTVTFIANGGSGTMDPQFFTYGVPQALTVHSFSREGYGFTGWNVDPNGTGAAYTDGQTITVSSDLTLYAQWKANSHTVTFIANGGTGTMEAESFEYGELLNLTPNAFTREGYKFTGWNTAPDGSGDAYSDGALITIEADLTLYAQWTADTLTVSFDANGGTGIMEDQPFMYGVSQPLNAHSFTREGFGFTGWNTEPDGSGDSYTDGQTITITSDMTLYAQWAAYVHTVTFIANGGEGTMAAESFEYGETLNLTPNAFTREGYRFSGWNTAADGSGESFSDGQEVTIDADLTLYAQWIVDSRDISITVNGHGSAQVLSGDIPVQSAQPGEEITLIVTPDEEYELHLLLAIAGGEEISLTKIDEQTYTFIMPAEEITISAVFVSNDPNAAVIEADPLGADDLVYNGAEQELLSQPAVVSGGIALYSVNGGPYSPVLPRGLDAGTYIITWYAAGDETHNDNGAPDDPIEILTVVIAQKSVTVTADDKIKIEGDDDPDLTATVEGLIGSDIIAYALYRTPGETAGIYDIIPTGESSQGNYFLTFVNGAFIIIPPGSAVILVRPEGAEGLTWTGSPQFLLSAAGDAAGGTILYSVNGGPYSDELPRGIDIGDYTITWYVAGDENHTDLGSPEEPFGTIAVTISPEIRPKEPMELPVKINFIKKDGSRGIPEESGEITLNFTLKLEGPGGSAKSEAISLEVYGGMRDVELDAVTFDDTPQGLLSEYNVIVEGLPASVHGKAPAYQRYRLTAHAWINNQGGITIELIWDDGKNHGPEEPYVYPLPEDEIGAYWQDAWGNKTYLLFHTYEICMRWLGSDELCSGYERCFHKELPYVYDKNKIRTGYDWQPTP